jgi:hypothetical protein
MGQEHGIGFDGLADDRPRAQIPKSLADIVKPEKAPVPRDQSLKLQLRWEGALPVRVAELKAGVVEPPSLTDGHYCIAVYGVPLSRVKGDPRTLGEPLRKMAVLRRAGKKDVTPTSVEVFQREDGMVIVYAFPYSAEITKNDERIDFEARIGRIGIVQSFVLQEMRFHGNLEM